MKPLDQFDACARLLGWYDRYGRELPWRYKGGAKADPYRVWLSEIMCQQTTVQAVIPYFLKFLDLWPDIKSLAVAPQERVMAEWAGLGYYARARNLHKCAQIVALEHDGIFPASLEGLRDLPGIGEYTAAAIGAIAFGIPSAVVDGNVERVISRLYAVEEPLPQSKKLLKQLAAPFFTACPDRPGDLAQAVMDLGAMICIPQTPKCGLCPLSSVCRAYETSRQNVIPFKLKPGAKPQKFGIAYWVENNGSVLLERRGAKGILGGMTGFPSSDWIEDRHSLSHPDFLQPAGDLLPDLFIRHSFTHFDLQLFLAEAELRTGHDNNRFFWCAASELEKAGLPTLFKKALKLRVKG